MPVGAYVTALEVWLSSCSAFIMLALIQTVVQRGMNTDQSVKTGKLDTIPLAEVSHYGGLPLRRTP